MGANRCPLRGHLRLHSDVGRNEEAKQPQDQNYEAHLTDHYGLSIYRRLAVPCSDLDCSEQRLGARWRPFWMAYASRLYDDFCLARLSCCRDILRRVLTRLPSIHSGSWSSLPGFGFIHPGIISDERLGRDFRRSAGIPFCVRLVADVSFAVARTESNHAVERTATRWRGWQSLTLNR